MKSTKNLENDPEEIKKNLYKKIRLQVTDRLGVEDLEIQKNEKRLGQIYRKKWKKTNPELLQKKIIQSNLIFWGDFHGVRQFQKSLWRWIKKQDFSNQPFVLALECLPYKCQKWVDEYLAGRLSEDDFLQAVNWDKVWGFPWSHYKPLFEWARENKQSVIVINGPKLKSSSIEREKWGLSLIQHVLLEKPDAKVFILYGEYHLLPTGFRALTKKNKLIKPLFIFQNSEELYFQKPPALDQAGEEVLICESGEFCLQNMSPWVKWQNYNLFLDSSNEAEFDDDLDLTEHVLGLSQILSQTLKIKLDPNHFAVFTSSDRALWDHLKKLPEQKLFLFEAFIEQGLSFVDQVSGWAFLGRISANETASLAMQSLMFQLNPDLNWDLDEESLWNCIFWIHAFSYFGSKIINPHRKSISLPELQKKARIHSGRPIERQAARLALNYTLHHSLGEGQNFGNLRVPESVRFQAVKWMASLLGEKLFAAYLSGNLSLRTLKSFLEKRPQTKNFEIVIQSLFETLEA